MRALHLHFQYTKDKISRYQILAQNLRLIYQIIIRSISLFSFFISLTPPFSPQNKIEWGRREDSNNKQKTHKGTKITSPPSQEASDSFHIKMHLTITHAKTCFDAHSKKETTHLVLAFGFPKKLLYSIHGLLEALTLVNLYHFLLVSVIRLQLLHFDPSTRNQKKKKLVIFSEQQLSQPSHF